MSEDNLIFICMTDASVKKARAYKFLETIKEKFRNTYDKQQIDNAIPYGLEAFGEQLRTTIVLGFRFDNFFVKNQFNYNVEEEDKAETVLKELVDTKDVMVHQLSMI